MRSEKSTMRASAEAIEVLRAGGESRSDWSAAEAMSQADIERLADEDDGGLAEGWERTVEIGLPVTKQAVHLRLDRDVLGWFRAHGPGYQTRINAVLKAFVQARRQSEQA